jgi:hypothetical protein
MPMKMEKTAIMMSAALETTPALLAMPAVTAPAVVSPRRRHQVAHRHLAPPWFAFLQVRTLRRTVSGGISHVSAIWAAMDGSRRAA